MSDYLLQTERPLFPKILWNRPVNRQAAGRLLIVGGHSGDFSQVQAAYQLAQAAGIGQCRVMLPDALARTVAGLPDTILIPSSPSGSLARGALGEILHHSQDYDAVLIGLNWSNNSESSVLVESLLSRLPNVILAGDGLEAIKFNPAVATNNADCLIVADMRQLFRLAGALKVGLKIAPDQGVMNQVGIGQAIGQASQCKYLVYDGWLMAVSEHEVSLTELKTDPTLGGAIAGLAATLWLQNPKSRFKAMTSACYLLAQAMVGSDGPDLRALTRSISATLSREDFV